MEVAKKGAPKGHGGFMDIAKRGEGVLEVSKKREKWGKYPEIVGVAQKIG